MDQETSVTRRAAFKFAGALALALAPFSSRSQTEESAPAARLRRAYADGPDGQIHYRFVRPAATAARRPPLLCLHASPLSGIVYDNWLVEMGRDRLALAPDTPGYGGSDAPSAPPAIADYARAFVRLLDDLNLGAVDVMGYHTGSMTAVEMARSFPQRVRRVVMISAPLFTAEELAALRAGLRETPNYESLLASNLDNWRRQGKGMFRDEPTDDRYADIMLDRMRRFRTATWGFRAAFAYDLAAALPEVRQPILLLNPEDDLWKMTPRALRYARTATLHDLPGWTHGHLDAHTAEMAAIVRQFLDTPA